jgi:hypothetical protein
LGNFPLGHGTRQALPACSRATPKVSSRHIGFKPLTSVSRPCGKFHVPSQHGGNIFPHIPKKAFKLSQTDFPTTQERLPNYTKQTFRQRLKEFGTKREGLSGIGF